MFNLIYDIIDMLTIDWYNSVPGPAADGDSA